MQMHTVIAQEAEETQEIRHPAARQVASRTDNYQISGGEVGQERLPPRIPAGADQPIVVEIG
jgi:hypothetical protein